MPDQAHILTQHPHNPPVIYAASMLSSCSFEKDRVDHPVEQCQYAQDHDPEEFVLVHISTVVEKFRLSTFPHNAWFNE